MDVNDRLMRDEKEKIIWDKIAASVGESVFHDGAVIQIDEVEVDNFYADFGDGIPEKIHKRSDQRFKEAARNWLSDKGVEQQNKTPKYNEIFKSTLDRGKPADVLLVKIALDGTNRPVKE